MSANPSDIERIARAVEAAWRANRAIVPIIGAGLSADSGFPVLRSVVRYLAKLHALVGLPAVPARSGAASAWFTLLLNQRYNRKPWQFVADFNWPDRFQLNQDLFQLRPHAAREERPQTITRVVAEELSRLAPVLNPAAMWPYKQLHKDAAQVLVDALGRVGGGVVELLAQNLTELLRRAGVPPELITRANRLVKGARQDVEGAQRAARGQLDERFRAAAGWSVPYDVYGDWRRLIQHSTKHQTDFADSLFAMLGRNKRPNPGHRYLTFLAKLLSVKAVFTFNFDDLIERAFEAEGMRPKVFAMEEGRTLPHGSLVTEGVSVVKLHGGTHSLLLDERLDRPLGPDYLSRFDQLVGDDPFLLVIGCSGGDYRLTSLVDHVLAQAPRTAPKGDPVERVAWLHFESYWPAPLVANPDSKPEDQKLKDGVLAARTTQPSSALTYLYSFMTSRYPASNHTYPSGAGHALAYARRVDPPRVGDVADLFARKNLAGEEEKVFLLSTIKLTELDGGADKAVRAGAASDPTPHTGRAPAGDVNKEFPMVTASDALLDVAHYGLNYGYTPILINLEAVNTLSGLVGTIVDSCRQCDTALVPSVLPSEDHAQTGEARAHLLSKAVALVANALQRSRYVVLLDGLETYLWNATSHHGETTTQNADPENRFRLLCAFIQNLRAAQGHEPLPFAPAGGRAAGAAPGAPSPAVPKVNDIGESRIVIGLDQRVPRNEHSGRVPQIGAVLKQSGFDQLPELHLGAEIQAHLRFTDFFVPADYLHAQTIWPGSDTGAQRDTLGLLLLVACRRARPLALVRHLLRPVFNRPDAIDAFLRQLTENRSGAFVTLEGGVTWISRPVRDHLYTEATRYTSTRSMRTLLGGGDLKDL
ncbi:MAG TPA: SIR2 family protein, partial [Gemmata sp.]